MACWCKPFFLFFIILFFFFFFFVPRNVQFCNYRGRAAVPRTTSASASLLSSLFFPPSPFYRRDTCLNDSNHSTHPIPLPFPYWLRCTVNEHGKATLYRAFRYLATNYKFRTRTQRCPSYSRPCNSRQFDKAFRIFEGHSTNPECHGACRKGRAN